jgi:hypothetical protein
VLYQLRLQREELCRICAIWKRKVRSLPDGDDGNLWGPSDVELHNASVSEITGRWAEGSGSENEMSESSDESSDDADAEYFTLPHTFPWTP